MSWLTIYQPELLIKKEGVMGSTLRLFAKVARVLLLMGLAFPLNAFAVKYCTDVMAFPGDFGEMSFEVVTDDASATAIVSVVAGMAKGWEFTGDWHPDGRGNGIAEVFIDEDPVVGYLAFDIYVESGVSVTGYIADGVSGSLPTGAEAAFFGSAGACTAAGTPLIGSYCLKIGNENRSLEILSESVGLVRGRMEVDRGSWSTFRAHRDSTGLVLRMTSAGTTFDLEFAGNLISGRSSKGGRRYDVYGIRNPITGVAGCDGIKIYSHGSANYYYSTPTIVGRYAYVGTAGGSNHTVASDNFLAKIDLKTMSEVWRYDLGTREVRGSAVLDSRGAIYFMAETGRAQEIVSGIEPSGDHSGSHLKLVKLSNPTASTPRVIWERVIVGEGGVYHLGQITPAISEFDVIIVGGRSVRAYRANGTMLWEFSPTAGTQEFYNSPLVDDKTVFVNSDGGGSESSAATPNRIYAIDAWSGSERWSYTPTTASHYDGLSSPQFNRDRTRIYTALRQTLYCFDKWGNACSFAWEGGCEIPGISGDLRASPLVDASGDIYIGTKDDADSVFYKIDGSCPNIASSRVLWEVETRGDVYTTGVLLDSGYVVIGQEPDSSAGVLKALNMSDGSLEGYVDLTADMTWGSLRVDHGRLVGVADVATPFLGGFLFSINFAGARYATGAENPTMRGDNAGSGR